MSLAKRIFDGFLNKKDREGEPAPDAEPPLPGTAAPSPPREARPETPLSASSQPERHAARPAADGSLPVPPSSGMADAPVRPEAAPATPVRMRIMPLRGGGGEGQSTPGVDPVRSSLGTRPGPGGPVALTGGVSPEAAARADALRRAQAQRPTAPPRPGAADLADTAAPLARVRPPPDSAPPQGVELPLRAVLLALPPSQRGPAWTPGSLPRGSLFMDREQLRSQLAAGHVCMPAEEARQYLPEGWLDADVLGDVDLDLAEVMAATPLDLIPVRPPPQPPPGEPAAGGAVPPGAADPAATPMARVPCAAVLAGLPVPLRGPAWRAQGMPDRTLPLAKNLLLGKLRTGRVTLDVESVAAALPPGWLVPGARGEIDLDLAIVVGALPAEWLELAEPEDHDAVAAQSMATLFAPATAASPPAAAPAAAAAAPRAAAPASQSAARPPPPAGDRVSVPAALVLQALPPALRGPTWHAAGPPDAAVSLPREQLLRQLATGRVELTLDQARAQLPAGMCSPDAQGTVALDLAALIEALPAELIQVTCEVDQDVTAAAAIRDLFAPITPPATTVVPGVSPPPAAAAAVPGETIALPCAAMLSQLPPALRGPAWRAAGFPDVLIDLPKTDLLNELATGSVSAPLALLRGRVPDGWVAAGASGSVALDLATVVAAIPAEMLAVPDDLSDEVPAATPGTRPFALASAASPAALAPPVVTSPAPVAAEVVSAASVPAPRSAQGAAPTAPAPAVAPSPPPPATEAGGPPAPAVGTAAAAAPPPAQATPEAEPVDDLMAGLPAWNGVEEAPERAPSGIDLNTARAADLMQLPGVGGSQAQAILAYRASHGPYASVYGLADVPGVGPDLFQRLTGLSARHRVDRHAAVARLLSLPAGETPLLSRILTAMRTELGASGAVLAALGGLPLAVSGPVPEAELYATLGSSFFRVARRHLREFITHASDCILLPGSTPPLLLLSCEDVVVILALSAGGVVPAAQLDRVRRALREVGWLLSRRAVVFRA